MEALIDKLISEVKLLAETDSANGGIADVLPLKSIYFGDPGIVPASLYPWASVEPDIEDPQDGSTGYDKKELRVHVTFHVDAREFFNADSEEAQGDRALVKAVAALTHWFQRRSKRQLDGQVQDLKVQQSQYRPIERGSVMSKDARTTLLARKNYVRVLD